ncbi:TPA: hypothetical protein ACGOY5_002210 [Streptococcus suis]
MNKYTSKQNNPEERNRIFARGKVVDIVSNGSDYSIEVFVRNGAGRQHTYLFFSVDAESLPNQLKKGTTVHITGHIENFIDSRSKPTQRYVADIITPEKTELARYFRKDDFQFGFAPQRHYAKLFVAGEVIRVIHMPGSNWIQLIIRDRARNNVKLQFSKNMRVADCTYQQGGYVYVSAIPISTSKSIEGQIVRFENLIIEDIVSKDQYY